MIIPVNGTCCGFGPKKIANVERISCPFNERLVRSGQFVCEDIEAPIKDEDATMLEEGRRGVGFGAWFYKGVEMLAIATHFMLFCKFFRLLWMFVRCFSFFC